MAGTTTNEKRHANPTLTEDIVDVMIKKWNDEAKKDSFDIKEVHLKLLDDLVNVNSLLTIGVFVGLSMTSPGIRSLDTRDECNATPNVAKMLIVYEVVAFSCFLLSSIVAKVLKLHLYLDGTRYDFVHRGFDLKDLMLILASTASVFGIILLVLSIVNIIQIRIGMLSCGVWESKLAVIGLGVIVGIALVIYVVSMAIAIFASFKSDAHVVKSEKAKIGTSSNDNSFVYNFALQNGDNSARNVIPNDAEV